jgi:hypothetical protein
MLCGHNIQHMQNGKIIFIYTAGTSAMGTIVSQELPLGASHGICHLIPAPGTAHLERTQDLFLNPFRAVHYIQYVMSFTIPLCHR